MPVRRKYSARGAARPANSVVCYCLEITEVDPSAHAMLFERFISKERNRAAGHRRGFRARAARRGHSIHLPEIRPRASGSRPPPSSLTGPQRAARCRARHWDWISRKSTGWHAAFSGGMASGSIRSAPRFRFRSKRSRIQRLTEAHVGDPGFPLTCRSMWAASSLRAAVWMNWFPLKRDDAGAHGHPMDKDDLDAAGICSRSMCLRSACFPRYAVPFNLVNEFGGSSAVAGELILATVPSRGSGVYDMIAALTRRGISNRNRGPKCPCCHARPRNYYDLVIGVAIVRPGPIQGEMVHPYLRRATTRSRELSEQGRRSGPQTHLGVPISRSSHAARHRGGRLFAGRG